MNDLSLNVGKPSEYVMLASFSFLLIVVFCANKKSFVPFFYVIAVTSSFTMVLTNENFDGHQIPIR